MNSETGVAFLRSMSLLLEGAAGFIESMFGRFHYSAPFVVLLLCGIGLPLPEEVTLIGSGVLLYQDKVSFLPIVLVCSTAILLGDSIPYWLGRRYGMSILKHRLFKRLMRPGRIRLLERRMKGHANWVIFTCRFLPGIRIPGYFTAGLMRMSYPRFLILDGLGVLITVPVSIWLGSLFGESIDHLKSTMKDFHLLLGLLVLSLVLIMLVRARTRARLRQERQLAAEDENEPEDGPHRGPEQENGSAHPDATKARADRIESLARGPRQDESTEARAAD